MGLLKYFNKLKAHKSISIPKFIYYNFLCKSVKRDRKCFIVPYRNSIIDIDKKSRLNLHANYIMNSNKLSGSKAECFLRMRRNSELNIRGPVNLYYNTTIELLEDAVMNLGKMGANSGTVITCAKKITIGNDVVIARNVIIYDSDHHQVIDNAGNSKNKAKEVVIGNNVWLGVNSTVLKGVKVGNGAIISANSWVGRSVKPNCLVACLPARTILTDVNWEA